ncbi:MAG: 1-deoxy-D-xylulose-5-phosphate reductoisomerase [Phycisphaerales bacterium]
MERRVIILGSTGSIGTQTLEVIEHLNGLHARGAFPDSFRVVGLGAGSNTALLAEQAVRTGCTATALSDARGALELRREAGRTFAGRDGLEELVREVPCDLVVGAVVGVAGLPATMAAVELGRDVALANKETLVAAGGVIVPAAKRTGARLLPVDSEHAGAWQCLAGLLAADECPPMRIDDRLSRLVLTASGGPFRTWTREQIEHATPEQALRHPTWSMGRKVSIDSASLMNKVLEVIEAHWLFGLEPERIGVAVHPQSLVHAAAEMRDGSVIAQLGAPDMRCPIQSALTWPLRPEGACRKLGLEELGSLTFERPDTSRFPALLLTDRAIRAGGTSGAVLNAANECAVEAFLEGRLAFVRIPDLVDQAMSAVAPRPANTLECCLRADAEAREFVRVRLLAGAGESLRAR